MYPKKTSNVDLPIPTFQNHHSLKYPGCSFWNTPVGSYFFEMVCSLAWLVDP